MLGPMSMVPGLAQGDAGLRDAGLHGLRGTTGHASRRAAGSRQLTLSRPPDSLVSGFVLSLIGAIFFTFGQIALFASESRVSTAARACQGPQTDSAVSVFSLICTWGGAIARRDWLLDRGSFPARDEGRIRGPEADPRLSSLPGSSR